MISDRNIDKAGLIETFVVASGKTVTPGRAVKLSGAPTNPNIREIEECDALTDIPIGLARGVLGDNKLPDTTTGRLVPGKTAFIAGDKVEVLLFWSVCELAIAGAAGVTVGNRVTADAVTGNGTLVDAPAMNAAGSTATNSPGLALDTAAEGEAFALAFMPSFYPST